MSSTFFVLFLIAFHLVLSSSASQSTRPPVRHDVIKHDVITPKRNSTNKTPTRKQFHGNDLIFSGNGDGDGDSECIPWNEDLCPTDANNEDALIVPTTERTRSKPIDRYPISTEDDDWSGSRPTVECLSDDDEDCQITSIVATPGGKQHPSPSKNTVSSTTSSSFSLVPSWSTSGRRTSSRSTTVTRQHPVVTTVPFHIANAFTSITRRANYVTDINVPPTTTKTARMTTSSPSTSSPSPAPLRLPIAPLSTVSKIPSPTSSTATSTTRSAGPYQSSSATPRTLPVVEPISSAPRPSQGGAMYSVPENLPSMPSDQSPAAGLLDAAVPVNISLIAGVAVAVAILLCMLVYVVVKWSAPANSGLVSGSGRHVMQVNGMNCAPDEKSALRDFDPCHERSPPLYSAPGNTINGNSLNSPHPVAIYMGAGDGGKQRGDVKEWFV